MKEQTNFFPKNLQFLRKEKRLTQAELANKINVDQTTIGRWEDGNRKPTVGNVANIAEIFNVSIPDLLDKDLANSQTTKIDEIEKLFNKAKPHLSPDDEETIKFIMNKTIKNYEESKKKDD